jgi:hypothetical protein
LGARGWDALSGDIYGRRMSSYVRSKRASNFASAFLLVHLLYSYVLALALSGVMLVNQLAGFRSFDQSAM